VIRKVIWLPQGLAEDPLLRGTIVGNYVGWGTGGHTDEFVRFADARTVLLAWPEEAEAATHPVARLNRQRMQRNADILSSATDAQGRRCRLLKVPMPKIIERRVFLCRPRPMPPSQKNGPRTSSRRGSAGARATGDPGGLGQLPELRGCQWSRGAAELSGPRHGTRHAGAGAPLVCGDLRRTTD
jgi:hypothetical protein